MKTHQAERDFRNQQLIPDTPPPKVPETGLKAKKPQTNKPTLLEVYEEEVKQPKLF